MLGALICPLQKLSLACRRAEHSSVRESGSRAAGRKQPDCIAQPASAGRCKGNDGLAGQVMSLKEGIDDPGRDIPPYGEAQIDRVIVCHAVTEHLHFRPAGRIAHLNGAAGRLILPVQILLRVSNPGWVFQTDPRQLLQQDAQPLWQYDHSRRSTQQVSYSCTCTSSYSVIP